jgi:pimeloyl-ACP methyl ester carboxylesterase
MAITQPEDCPVTRHIPGGPGPGHGFVRLGDGDMHVVQDGQPGAPALLLIHGSTASAASWDPVVPSLASTYRVIRVDLPGHGRSSSPATGYDIPAQARRVGAALDRIGASRVTVAGHSMGCMVATALAEQRPATVAALALIGMGPGLDAKIPDGLLLRLLQRPFPGRLMWRLRTKAAVRQAIRRCALARRADIPDAMIRDTLRMTYRAFAATTSAALEYLWQRTLPDRLAVLGVPVLVIAGSQDPRYRSSSAAAYRSVPGARVELLPGVGHFPMLEDPQTTSALLLDFAAADGYPG